MLRINKHSQRGTAIIVALFVMAIVVAASVAMISRLHVDIKRTESLLNAQQEAQYAQGSVAWAIDKLNMNWQQRKADLIIDKIPITSPADTVNGYKITSVIYDAQSLFNLNNLTVSDYQFDFLHLLKFVEPSLKNNEATKITIAIHDWVSPSNSPDLAAFYAGLTPAYRAPHAPMASISELRLIKGMTPALYTKLLPFVTALPGTTPVNVNNASAPVLMSLNQSITYPIAQKIMQIRKATPFLDVQKFNDQPELQGKSISTGKTTVVSNYFLLETKVSIGQQQTILYTLLSRVAQGPKSTTSVLWQMKGTL